MYCEFRVLYIIVISLTAVKFIWVVTWNTPIGQYYAFLKLC